MSQNRKPRSYLLTSKIAITKCWLNRKDGGVMLVTIPKPIHDELNIKSGTTFIISYDKNKTLTLKKID
jgi:AbrB family looped-hinge helix DNA binding protein